MLCGGLCGGLVAVDSEPVLSPPNAFLLNNNAVPVGHYGALEAGATIARPTGTEAIWYNPALLADLPSTSLSASASVYERQIYESSAAGLDSDQTVFVSIPSFVGGNLGSLETGTQFAFGLVTPNSFSQSVNLTTTVPVTTGGTGRLVINSQSSSETLRPVIGFGQRINQEWSVGFRLDGVYSTLSTLRTADWRFVNDDGSLNTIVNEIENYDATVYAVSAAASVIWTPNEKWSIGFMAVAPTYVAQNDGDVNVTFFREDPNSVINAFLNTSSVEANLEDPGSVHLGVGYTAGLEWSIEAAVRLYFGRPKEPILETPDFAVGILTDKNTGETGVGATEVSFADLQYDAIISFSLGGRWRVAPSYMVHAGYQYDPSPINPDSGSGFSSLDLHMFRAGFTKQAEHLASSFGIGLTYGKTTEVYTIDLDDGIEETEGSLRMWSASLILGTTYQF